MTATQAREKRVAVERIVGFAKRYGEDALNLACHTAFPLVLTPDLLYQIWANFVTQAPWTGVARVLLSPLCREVGFEMYEMDLAVRNLLLRELQEQFGKQRFEELAEFLQEYVLQRLNSEDPDIQDIAQAQNWTALAYTKPGEAARELAEALVERLQQQDKAEVFRLTSLVETFAQPLVEAGFQPLLVYAGGIKSYVRGDLERAKEQFKLLHTGESEAQIAGVPLSIPLGESEVQIAEVPLSIPPRPLRGKLVVMNILEGDFEHGFPVIVEIGADGARAEIVIRGHLPEAPYILESLNEWQEACHKKAVSRSSQLEETVFRAIGKGRKQFSVGKSAELLKSNINRWLNSGDLKWQKVREKFLENLSKDEEIRIIIQTEESLLRQLPWQEWDLFRDRLVEVAVSEPEYQLPRVTLQVSKHSRGRILAVLGDCPDIDIEFDRTELEKLRDRGAEIEFLDCPTKTDLIEKLWQNPGWQIFFFAGHSETDDSGKIGKIALNQTETLTLRELKYTFNVAIANGLQLAIFNSCDGLGLAKELAKLHLPQSIVMRQPIPDRVAQDFLKYFLAEFAAGQSLYGAVRTTRLKLADLWDTEHPGVSWLPVICQNPSVMPLSWRDFLPPPS